VATLPPKATSSSNVFVSGLLGHRGIEQIEKLDSEELVERVRTSSANAVGRRRVVDGNVGEHPTVLGWVGLDAAIDARAG
jgi:hypothetical protein